MELICSFYEVRHVSAQGWKQATVRAWLGLEGSHRQLGASKQVSQNTLLALEGYDMTC